jgi:hypothetical protein
MTQVLVAILASGAAMAQGTRLASDGKVLFQAATQVTFGASYGEHAVRATVVAPTETEVQLRVDGTPKNVFLNLERMAPGAWRHADHMVVLTVPAGTSELQIRFDGVTSLKPVDHPVPVVLVENGKRRKVAQMVVTIAKGKARGSLSWPGPAGFFQAAAMRQGKAVGDVTLGVREAPAATFAGVSAFYLDKEDVLTLAADAPDFRLPLDTVELRVAAVCSETTKVAKSTLDWQGSVVVEGEAFSKQGGGEIKISNEHKNTHAGGCAFAWAKPGHWLEWKLAIPRTGDYVLTVVGASQEKVVLRSAEMDGKPLPGAGVIRLEGTGGWGRENPDEWQPFRPVDDTGKPVRIPLTKGTHVLRMTNLVGQHFNVDAILLTPVK